MISLLFLSSLFNTSSYLSTDVRSLLRGFRYISANVIIGLSFNGGMISIIRLSNSFGMLISCSFSRLYSKSLRKRIARPPPRALRLLVIRL